MFETLPISRRVLALIAALSLFLPALSRAAHEQALSESDLWARLAAGGHVAVLRHALAPGSGDPANFALGDCTTQRNLSDRGRAQARGIGAAFRRHGIESARVYSSQWCRCLETAELLGLGPVEPQPLLNSFFATREAGDEQTEALRAWLLEQPLQEPLVLVTHQVNIRKLTGIYPGSGETVVVRPEADGTVTALGRLPPP